MIHDGETRQRFQACIHPLIRPLMPVLIYEEEGALLRRRADLAIPLRVRDTLVRENRRPGIAQPPAVNIVE